jgi:hypothetical protein
MSLMAASVIVLWLVNVITVLAVAGLVRQNKVLEAQVRRLSSARGRPAAEPTPDEIRRLAGAAPTLAAFYVDAKCPSCDELLRALPRLATELRGRARMVVVPLTGALQVPGADLLVVQESSPLRAVDVPATPYVITWTNEGKFRSSAPVGSLAALEELVASIREDVEA